MSITSKVNKDSSRVYTVNNQEVIVTKAQLDEVTKVVKANNIKEPKVGDIKLGRGSALPAWLATIGATASWIMWKIGAGGFWVFRNISSYCGSKIDSCAGIIIGIIKGQQWAFDKARNWANGRN